MARDFLKKLNQKEATLFLQKINPVLDGSPFDMESSVVLHQELSFYPGWCFLDVTDHNVMPYKKCFVVVGSDDVIPLSDTSESIYDLNKIVPLALTVENIEDYVHFFFNHVSGPHGRFTVVENIDEIEWHEDPPIAVRRAINELIAPLTILSSKDNQFILEATMVFKNALFRVQITVGPDGMIDLSKEELLLEDMPLCEGILET